jgi:prephenate dehydratase
VIVGYQGIAGSFTEGAATELLSRTGVRSYTLDPCVTSREVVHRLVQRRIDLGVLALRNATAGEVAETIDALRGVAVREIDRCALPIVHCLYARTALAAAAIEHVHSHEQALRQCAKHLVRLCPGATTHAAEDTALAAQALASGAWPGRVAVVCSRAAGERLGLVLVEASIQDRSDNLTEFVLIDLVR